MYTYIIYCAERKAGVVSLRGEAMERQMGYTPPHYYNHPSQQQENPEGEEKHEPSLPQHLYGTFEAGPPAPFTSQYTNSPQKQQLHHEVPVYPVLERHPEDLTPLPCCGIGIGWFLFILGFFIVSVPWYAGAVLLLCTRPDPRERIGLVCCTIAAILSLVAAIIGGTTAAC